MNNESVGAKNLLLSPVSTESDGETKVQIYDHQELVKQQDEVLDDMSTVLSRLSLMSSEIHGELDTQGQMIRELGDNIDGTTQRLHSMQEKLDSILLQSGCSSTYLIFFLMIVVALLLFLIVYT